MGGWRAGRGAEEGPASLEADLEVFGWGKSGGLAFIAHLIIKLEN
jgi:hypothetical protein